jgi:hypothetical protein
MDLQKLHKADLLPRLLSAITNSFYSFWWDVTNDWGFSLLRFDYQGGAALQATSTMRINPPNRLHSDQRSKSNGLRPVQLLFDTPFPYRCAILVNFVLRLTWSLKLSPHLHHIVELESGVFAFEVLEIVRRWMWTYIRIEWEAIKMSDGPLPHIWHDERVADQPTELHPLPL